VQSVALPPPGAAAGNAAVRLPAIAATPPGDRRFAAREWDELPYFALLKQSYLLASDYAQQLAALLTLPEPERRRIAFLTRQAIDALAPTNFCRDQSGGDPARARDRRRKPGAGPREPGRGRPKGRISMTDERAFAVGTTSR